MRYLFEDYALDTDRRELRRGGTPVAIEPQVFDLLAYLVQHGDRVVTKDDLFTAVWNGRFVSESALTTRINAARTALGDDGKAQRLLRTLRGRGVRFVGDVRVSRDATSSTTAEAPPTLALPDRPSIAVLPFANLSGDPEQEYFADGMVDDILIGPVARALAVRDRPPLELHLQGPGPPMCSRSVASSACATWSRAACASPATGCASLPS